MRAHKEGREEECERKDAGVVCMIGTQSANAFSVDHKNINRFAVFALAGDGLSPYPKALCACCRAANQTTSGTLRAQLAALTINGRSDGKTISSVQQNSVHQK